MGSADCTSIFKSVQERFTEEDQKDFGVNELTKRVEERDKKESVCIKLTIVYAILSAIFSILSSAIMPKWSWKPPILAEYFSLLVIIAVSFVVCYFIVKKCSKRNIQSADDFAKDFIEYFGSPQKERIRKDKERRNHKRQ